MDVIAIPIYMLIKVFINKLVYKTDVHQKNMRGYILGLTMKARRYRKIVCGRYLYCLTRKSERNENMNDVRAFYRFG